MPSSRSAATDRPPTSADVARHAGVSRATVSYVLNDVHTMGISPQTCARVHQSARELGYVPHAMARLLRKRTSNLILIPETTDRRGPMVDTFYGEVRQTLTELGYTVITYTDRGGGGAADARGWAAFRPLGVLVNPRRLSTAAVDVLRATGTRVILGVGWAPSDLVPTLVQDHAGMGACAAEYLAGRGHRRIGVLVPREPRLVDLALERLAGCQRVADAMGLVLERVDLDFDEDAAAELARRWQAPSEVRPSAVFTYNDEFAMLLMRALLDASVRIPEDIALVGADDLPLCRLLRPRLTSVQMDARSSGHLVAETLHGMIEGRLSELPTTTLLHSRIIVRESA